MVVAAGRQEQGLRDPRDDVKAEDADVEVVHAVDVRGLQVHVADVHTRSDGPVAPFDRGDAARGRGVSAHRFLPTLPQPMLAIFMTTFNDAVAANILELAPCQRREQGWTTARCSRLSRRRVRRSPPW